MITQERLKELLHYDPETGVFTRRKSFGGMFAGSVVGSPDKDGYLQASIDYKKYKLHRLAWFYANGEFPLAQIDHINRDKSDNSLKNLRIATNAENGQNLPKRKSNKSGNTGVGWCQREGKWRARIGVNNKDISLGYYSTSEDAIAARTIAKAKYHTFHSEDTKN
jgi:hypothetical protein